LPRKLLLATSVLLLLSFGAVVSAAPLNVSTTNEFSTKEISWTVTLKVGETYQLPYGRNYKYYPYPNGGSPHFKVSSTGLVTALKNPYLREGEPVDGVGIVQEGVKDIGEIFIVITD
jgi:uncharacterized protein YycO